MKVKYTRIALTARIRKEHIVGPGVNIHDLIDDLRVELARINAVPTGRINANTVSIEQAMEPPSPHWKDADSGVLYPNPRKNGDWLIVPEIEGESSVNETIETKEAENVGNNDEQ